MNLTINKKRIESIDILRGLVMVIMALDHVRDFFHNTAFTQDPMDLSTTTPVLFFTRWITHFCAPVFIFLSGTSIYLQGLRKEKKTLSLFLIKRGLWLILFEVVLNSFGWTFNPHYNFISLQVIWAIGISMLLLGFIVYLPYKLIFALGLAIVVGHNLLDYVEASSDFKHSFLLDLLHAGRFSSYPFTEGHSITIIYPFLPWTGLMILGFCFGKFYEPDVSSELRRKKITIIGCVLILFFILLRFSNFYGDPSKWSAQKDLLFTIFSFISVHKYPPSLLYMCMTIGPAMIFLALIEHTKNILTNGFKVFGRVALFYYLMHVYLIHTLCMITFFLREHTLDEGTNSRLYFIVPGEGYNLGMVYIIWIAVVIILYPLCKSYDRYKTNHPENWWLSYM